MPIYSTGLTTIGNSDASAPSRGHAGRAYPCTRLQRPMYPSAAMPSRLEIPLVREAALALELDDGDDGAVKSITSADFPFEISDTVPVCYRWRMLKARKSAHTFRVRGMTSETRAYVETLLASRGVNGETSEETLLVFDALVKELARRGLDEDTELEIEPVEKLGGFQIRVGFEGEVFAREAGSADSAEDQVLGAYGDKLAYNYHVGHNAIGIWVSRGHSTSILACAVASLCAIVA